MGTVSFGLPFMFWFQVFSSKVSSSSEEKFMIKDFSFSCEKSTKIRKLCTVRGDMYYAKTNKRSHCKVPEAGLKMGSVLSCWMGSEIGLH